MASRGGKATLGATTPIAEIAPARARSAAYTWSSAGIVPRVLQPLVDGKSLGEALESVEAECTDPDVLAQTGANLMVWFREWVDAGFFTRIELASEPTEP